MTPPCLQATSPLRYSAWPEARLFLMALHDRRAQTSPYASSYDIKAHPTAMTGLHHQRATVAELTGCCPVTQPVRTVLTSRPPPPFQDHDGTAAVLLTTAVIKHSLLQARLPTELRRDRDCSTHAQPGHCCGQQRRCNDQNTGGEVCIGRPTGCTSIAASLRHRIRGRGRRWAYRIPRSPAMAQRDGRLHE